MNIENMHPFCLPFSLCHDATSSSMVTDMEPTQMLNSSSDSNTGTLDEIISSNNNSKEPIRSKTLSPSDDMFNHLNTNSSSSQSLLNDDSIIGSSDINADDTTAFYSLQLGIDIGTDIGRETDITDDFGFHEDEDSVDLCKTDDWFTTHYSLFSPTGSINPPKRRKSLIRTTLLSTHNHQVFQNVDPMDIKSSPTLAQLNLNSNDDPTDGFWDTSTNTASTNSTLISTAVTSAPSSDLLSNCTSINGGSSNCANNNLATCNQLHHQTQNHHTLTPYTHLNNTQLLPPCHHFHHHHNQSNRFVASHSQSTCLAVPPFRRNSDIHLNHHSSCCHNHLLSNQTNTNINSNPQQQTIGYSHKSPITQNQHSQFNHTNCDASSKQLTTVMDKQNQHKQTQIQATDQQRCVSPALVTSSSSPLSSSTSTALNTSNENRSIDNKLKENIEYLTALLCSGNKLDNTGNTQQPTISSTMIKSYATLAQSLSTGPKLLERQQQVPNVVTIIQQQPSPIALNVQQQSISTIVCGQHALTNDSLTHRVDQVGFQTNLQTHQTGTTIRSYPEHWFRPTVESSVSAADSTAENQVSCAERIQQMAANTSNICTHYMTTHNQQQNLSIDGNQGASKSSELKVLSSLLNSNKFPATNCPNVALSNNQPNGVCTNWHVADCNLHQNNLNQASAQQVLVTNNTCGQQQQQQLPEIALRQDTASIPPNGRPITLTPLVSNNSIIVQQQRQQPSKPKTPLFAQPASPSASSTASSCGNTETNSSSSTINIAARSYRTNHPQASYQKNNNSSDRVARPNSLSTDCSLSSHDEGFSSQVDNDDCLSTRDSDGDDDVDSDDESFYGDYTNNDLIGASISDNSECKWTLNMGRTRRNGQRRFFWQYNVQSKGPKGARICSTDGSDDPFILPEASDPVFSNDCQIEGVKHSGKARRGDGNDLTPNPKKLLMIGLELKKLGKIINDLMPVTDLPLNARNKTRKEKNKLASRACRLKKKAQHEANKIKLFGLQREHQQVVLAIYDVRKFLRDRLITQQENNGIQQQSSDDKMISSNVEAIAEKCSMKVASQTSDYVNSVLEKVVSGCIDGGLQS